MHKVSFRSIRKSDLETIRSWRNSIDISRNMFSSTYISKKDQLIWYDSLCRGERGYCWIVESENLPIGYASLSNAERSDDTFEFGLYIGNNDFLGKGYGSAILQRIFEEAFDNFNAHKVICEVLAFNIGAIKLYERFGMQKQGYFRDYLKRNNERFDCISFYIFRNEWQAKRIEFQEKTHE